MNETEKKLAEYRARKKREALINGYKSTFKNMLDKLVPNKEEKIEIGSQYDKETKEKLLPNSDSKDDSVLDIEEESHQCTTLDYVRYCLWLILWATLFSIFIKLQFGTVFFVLSLLIGMYLNTRTGPKKKNEPSAYSVFNENCESIQGTLDAEQLTKEIVYGGFSR